MSESIAEFAPFPAPTLQHNENGWGPCEIQEDFIYQPFSKSDRLGKISDWTGTTTQDKKYSSEWNLKFFFTFLIFWVQKF